MRFFRVLQVIHPLPSTINAGLVVSLAMVTGAKPVVVAALGVAMLGYQASIGALDDIVDADRDQVAKPHSPIPAGLVSRRTALGIVIVGGVVGSAISAGFGIVVLATGTAGYASGLAYDLFPRRRSWGWMCFCLALPLLFAWTWLAAAGSLPPGWPVLLPLAALAGPALHLANSLVDYDADRRAGTPSLATRLGFERARSVLAALMTTTYVLGWAALVSLASLSTAAAVAASAATILAAVGVTLSWRVDARAREWGWLLQAVGLALLAVTWVASMLMA